jgi:hypothetical protein
MVFWFYFVAITHLPSLDLSFNLSSLMALFIGYEVPRGGKVVFYPELSRLLRIYFSRPLALGMSLYCSVSSVLVDPREPRREGRNKVAGPNKPHFALSLIDSFPLGGYLYSYIDKRYGTGNNIHVRSWFRMKSFLN